MVKGKGFRPKESDWPDLVSLKTKKNLLSPLAVGVLLTFVLQMWRVGNLQTVILTDAIVITFGLGELLQGWFVKRVESVNEASLKQYGTKLLSNWWLFVGFFMGILVAGFFGTIFSEVVSLPTFATPQNATMFTAEAAVIVVLSFLGKYGPRPKKRLGEYFKAKKDSAK